MATTHVLTKDGDEVEVTYDETSNMITIEHVAHGYMICRAWAGDFEKSVSARLFDPGTLQTILMLAGR